MNNLLKQKMMLLVILTLVGSLFIVTTLVSAEDGYGAVGAEEKEDGYTLQEMLIYAIQDEYLARTEYELIMEEYGDQRPFSNIIQSEEYHISLLVPLFEKYGFEVPEDTSKDHVVIPSNIQEAFEIGVKVEIDNIAMYEKFLQQDITEDVVEVFEALKRGSENHLRAFKNGLDRNNGQGQGYKG